MSDLTPEMIEEFESLERAATPGPWTLLFGLDDGIPFAEVFSSGGMHLVSADLTKDAQLVAAMRNNLPDFLTELTRLRDENKAMKEFGVLMYNHGYMNGHHHTVEGYFTDIHQCDMETYHEDVVSDIVEDLIKSAGVLGEKNSA